MSRSGPDLEIAQWIKSRFARFVFFSEPNFILPEHIEVKQVRFVGREDELAFYIFFGH